MLDEVRLVLDGGDFHIARHGRLELLQALAQRRRRGHGVGIAFLVDRQLHRFLAAQADDRLALLVALAHLRHILQPHRHAAGDAAAGRRGGALYFSRCRQGRLRTSGRRNGIHLLHRRFGRAAAAALRGHQHVADLVQIHELVHRAHQVALRTFFQPAAGDVDVLLLEPGDHVVDRQVELGQLLLIDVDLNLVFQTAADLHRRHAGHRFELLFQVFVGIAAQAGELADRIGIGGRRLLGGQRQPHDRLGRGIETQQHRRLGFQRQRQGFHLVAHLQAGLVHIGAPGELQHHIALPCARDRLELAQVLDHADGFFHRLGHQRFDFRRRRAGVFGAYGERGIAQIGQQIDLEAA